MRLTHFYFYAILGFCLFSLAVMAQDSLSLRNEREGESYYHTDKIQRSLIKVANELGAERILSIYNDALTHQDPKKVCAFDLVKELGDQLKTIKDLKPVIHFLRSKNEFDDVSAKILLKAQDVVATNVGLPGSVNWAFLPKDKEVVKKQLELIASFEKRFLNNGCFDDSYIGLYGELLKNDEYLKDNQIKALFIEAHKTKLISDDVYRMLEQARVNSLQDTRLTLKTYLQKRKSLRTHYPLRDVNEKSEFVTDTFAKERMSRRQRIYEFYSDVQIILMGNLIKKLRSRLESPKMEILVYGPEVVEETIPLEPMERFRFAIKILRKEMSHLALNVYFNGSTPDYMDLLTAAYEIGIIPAQELDAVASLQDIWSPKKTFWEKGGIWIRSFVNVASLALPPPWGFVPTLALVIIEATVFKKEEPSDDVSRLF